MRYRPVMGLLLLMLMVTMGAQNAADERGQRSPLIEIEHAWVQRTPSLGQVEQGSHGGTPLNPDQTALYITVRNHGPQPEALLAASSAVATTGEFHQTLLQHGTTVMHPQSRFDIPAGETLAMTQGGAHIMLLGLKQALRVGETVPVTLTFEKAGPLSVEAVVR